MKRWLGRVHHDLIKHALWRARPAVLVAAAPPPTIKEERAEAVSGLPRVLP